MRDLDSEVRTLLQEMGEEAGSLEGLPMGIWRRTMVRRGATIVGAAAVTIALVVGGSMAMDSMSNRDGGLIPGPLPPANTFNNRPMPEDMKGRLIASGRVDDVDWWLAAYVDDERNLCTELATARSEGSAGGGTSTDLQVTGSIGGGCGPFDPKKHPIGMSVSSGDPLPTASGDVPDEVERVELILEGGDRIEAQLFAAPDGFEYPVRFYVIVPYPRGESARSLPTTRRELRSAASRSWGPATWRRPGPLQAPSRSMKGSIAESPTRSRVAWNDRTLPQATSGSTRARCSTSARANATGAAAAVTSLSPATTRWASRRTLLSRSLRSWRSTAG